MPERGVDPDRLATGAHFTGWVLTAWSLTMTVVIVTGQSIIYGSYQQAGLPLWLLFSQFSALTTLQMWGHGTRSARVLAAADLLGGFICISGAMAAGSAALHAKAPAAAVVNWATVGIIFLLHTVMLGQRGK